MPRSARSNPWFGRDAPAAGEQVEMIPCVLEGLGVILAVWASGVFVRRGVLYAMERFVLLAFIARAGGWDIPLLRG